jgi:hypothetical protein
LANAQLFLSTLTNAFCATAKEQARAEPYHLKGTSFEGCECESVCSCVFRNDASYNDCRGILAWKVDEGSYGKTDLQGLVFAAALTKSGKNMEQALGKWEGVVYLSDKSTDEQRKAVTEVLQAELGADFGKLEIKTAPLTVNCEGERHSIAIGQVGTLRIIAIKGASGKVPVIENAPFRARSRGCTAPRPRSTRTTTGRRSGTSPGATASTARSR